MTPQPLRLLLPLASGLVAAGLLAGCFNPFAPLIAPTRGFSESAPVPNSPQNILKLFEWCWDHQAINEYREVFSADFEFHFSRTDSAGGTFQNEPLTREMELETAENLFVRGSAREPPANRIQLEWASTLISQTDGRPGKPSPWHRRIAPQLTLQIDTDTGNYRVTGVAVFYVVRGDSALIPRELLDRDFSRTDSTRWYIERWNDETLGDSRALAPPTESLENLGEPEAAAASTAVRALGIPFRVTGVERAGARTGSGAEAAGIEPPRNLTWLALKALYWNGARAGRAPFSR